MMGPVDADLIEKVTGKEIRVYSDWQVPEYSGNHHCEFSQVDSSGKGRGLLRSLWLNQLLEGEHSQSKAQKYFKRLYGPRGVFQGYSEPKLKRVSWKSLEEDLHGTIYFFEGAPEAVEGGSVGEINTRLRD
jgi:hypothetical protein